MSDSKRWDLVSAYKDKNGNYRSTKVGVVFEGDKRRLQIKINPGIALLAQEGVFITGYPPKPKDGNERSSRGRSEHEEEDYVPF